MADAEQANSQRSKQNGNRWGMRRGRDRKQSSAEVAIEEQQCGEIGLARYNTRGQAITNLNSNQSLRYIDRMLDVHPPHKAIHGTGEFFLHLFTITVGLLIAVGIEGAVERHEHRKLAAEAAETMTAEIRKNQSNIADAIRGIEKHQASVNKNIATLQKVQDNPGGPEAANVSIDAGFSTTGLEHTAWRTAQATSALSYMPYEEAQQFSGIYEAAQAFEAAQDKSQEDEAQFLGLLRKHHISKGRISKEAADALAQQFGIWQGHLLVIHISARLVQEQQSAFLEHREPSHNLSESLGN